MNIKPCCEKWKSKDIIRIDGELSGAIEHLFKFCPECGERLEEYCKCPKPTNVVPGFMNKEGKLSETADIFYECAICHKRLEEKRKEADLKESEYCQCVGMVVLYNHVPGKETVCVKCNKRRQPESERLEEPNPEHKPKTYAEGLEEKRKKAELKVQMENDDLYKHEYSPGMPVDRLPAKYYIFDGSREMTIEQYRYIMDYLSSPKPKSEYCECKESQIDAPINSEWQPNFCYYCHKPIKPKTEGYEIELPHHRYGGVKPKKIKKLNLIYPTEHAEWMKPIFSKIDELIEHLNKEGL